MEIEQYVQSRLLEMQDLKYREFHSRLMPTVEKEKVIGVRTPALRKVAKEVAKMPEAKEFLEILPHKYYEENNLHGFLIEMIKDYDACIDALNQFLPYVDNWATCDLMAPKVLKKYPEKLLKQIKLWIKSGETYTVRFGIELLMRFYLDNNFSMEYPRLVAEVKAEEYYVKMMIAWYFATALAKRYGDIIPFLEEKKLEKWTHNKTIQKAIESYRITKEQKEYLRTLKL